MVLYLKIVALFLLVVGNLGFVLPYLFSADNTELVLLGVVNVVISIPVVYYVIKSMFKKESSV